MEHVGIDLGASKSQVCVVVNGEVVEERMVLTEALARWLAQRAPARVVMESCAESRAVARLARAREHEVFVVPTSMCRQIGIGARRMKNDVRDARALALHSYRVEKPQSVHLKSDRARDWATAIATRAELVRFRTELICQVKSRLRERLCPIRARFSGVFTERVRALISDSPEGLDVAATVALDTIDQLTGQIERLDAELEKLCEGDERVRRLTTVPGVGIITAMAFVATVDDVERFPDGQKLASYLGLIPGEATTGFRPRPTGITKAGPAQMRALLVHAAWALWRTRKSDPLVKWAEQVAARRNKKIAIIALARKLATVLLAIWRSEGQYDPRLGSPPEA